MPIISIGMRMDGSVQRDPGNKGAQTYLYGFHSYWYME